MLIKPTMCTIASLQIICCRDEHNKDRLTIGDPKETMVTNEDVVTGNKR